MKKLLITVVLVTFYVEVYSGIINNYTYFTIIGNNKPYNDSNLLPSCIKALSKPASKGIRSSIGSLRYVKKHILKDGRMLYAFQSNASIGCHVNEPESTKYYNDSCKLVAWFPMRFSIKQGFKPFIAAGYTITDFGETSKGDYPAYFATLEKTIAANKIAASKIRPPDPFPVENFFKINVVKEQILDFKKGDVLSISTKNGLKHYRNKKLLNTYKIIPQLISDENRFVYFLENAQRLIDIQNNILLFSTSTFKDANSGNIEVKILWKSAFLLSPNE